MEKLTALAEEQPRILQLLGKCQNYLWGQHGNTGLVGAIYEKAYKDSLKSPAQVAEFQSKPFAEYWMGTHFSCPSKVVPISIPSEPLLLSEYLSQHTSKQKTEMNFLFKILSINTALSIQLHPNKEVAKMLHSTRSKEYMDPNHKPELAIALTEFIALSGFLPSQDIIVNLEANPEILKIVGAEYYAAFKANPSEVTLLALMKQVFEMEKIKKEYTIAQLKELIERLKSLASLSSHQKLALTLYSQYSTDIGIFVMFFMNILTLHPGECLAMRPNEAHAYIHGNCVECMATSDNVIRCGLTPKYKDTETLLNCVCCKMGMSGLITPKKLGDNLLEYDAGYDEFVVHSIK